MIILKMTRILRCFTFTTLFLALYAKDDIKMGKLSIETPPKNTNSVQLIHLDVMGPKHTNGKTDRVSFSQHQIIPNDTLRDFYNVIMDPTRTDRPANDLIDFAVGMKSLIEMFLDNLKYDPHFYTMHGKDSYPALDLLEEMINGTITQSVRILNEKQARGLAIIQRLFILFPGSVFFRPVTNSKDDNSDYGLGNYSRMVVGKNTHDTLRQIYDHMRSYIDNRGRAGSSSANVIEIMDLIDDILPDIYISTVGMSQQKDMDWRSSCRTPLNCRLNVCGNTRFTYIRYIYVEDDSEEDADEHVSSTSSHDDRQQTLMNYIQVPIFANLTYPLCF